MIYCKYKPLIEKSKPGENRRRKAMGLPLKGHDCQAAVDFFVF
jgi:hypothetical protein